MTERFKGLLIGNGFTVDCVVTPSPTGGWLIYEVTPTSVPEGPTRSPSAIDIQRTPRESTNKIARAEIASASGRSRTSETPEKMPGEIF
jgi:hypothetical protein